MRAPILLSVPLLLSAPASAQSEDSASEPKPTPGPAATSFLAAPLFLDEEVPPVRAARNIHLVHTDVPNASREVTRTREETLELARHIATLAAAGEDFVKLAREYSAARNARDDAVLGSFPQGLLAKKMDAFLFGAELGEVSEPIETGNGIHLLQRVDALAASRHILVRGTSEESRRRCEALLERIRAGEDFGEVAKESSEDLTSAERGGLFTIFERGSRDRLLKAAAFRAAMGETVGPIESPSGFHLIQRVPLEGHDPSLRETTWVRARAILLSHKDVPSGALFHERTTAEAAALAVSLHGRIQAGEDMAELAREFNDDAGGKERSGDLGWLHRGNPRMVKFLDRAFTAEPGELLEPIAVNVGWVILRRER